MVYSLESRLIKACENKDIDSVIMLTEEGALVDYVNYDGETPLFLSCMNCCYDIISVLLNKGAKNISKKISKSELLHLLFSKDRFDIINLLINNILDINITDDNDNTILHKACSFNDIETVKKIISLGININKKNSFGYSAIWSAMSNGYEDRYILVEYLLNNGASIIDTIDCEDSLLHRAAMDKYIEGIRLLIKYNIDINAVNCKNETALYKATSGDIDIDIMKVLLENGADPNIYKDNGSSPLYNAVYHNNIESVKLLLDNGANINVPDMFGVSILERAEKDCFTDIKDLINARLLELV